MSDKFDSAPLDPNTGLDTDGDGIPDTRDPDDDNDGVRDENDALPFDPNETLTTTEMVLETTPIQMMITMVMTM